MKGKTKNRILTTELGSFKTRANGKLLFKVGDELIRCQSTKYIPRNYETN